MKVFGRNFNGTTTLDCIWMYEEVFLYLHLSLDSDTSEDLLTVSLRTANVVLFKKFEIMYSTSYA